MSWYDVFATVYDVAIEAHYTDHRRLAAEALDLAPGAVVLDVPCGTGQSFEWIRDGIGPRGTLIGVDLSRGMLRRAARRVWRRDWPNTHLLLHDARTLTTSALAGRGGRDGRVDRLHVFLGMSVFPDMAGTFDRLWELLAPGGRCVLVDVHAPRPNPVGRFVNQFARADIRRRFWTPLERVAVDFARRDLPSRWEHGGQIQLATGVKPATPFSPREDARRPAPPRVRPTAAGWPAGRCGP